MSAKVGATAPAQSITNLANKAINRLSNTASTNTTNHITEATADDDDESGDNEPDDEDAGIIRCICGFTDDDGFTIQCENCFVWQHAVCVGISQSNVPDNYLCELCSPRPMDKKRAVEIQRRRNGTIERKREKSPSRRKTSVGRPRKQFGSAGSGVSDQGTSFLPTSSSNSFSKDHSQLATSNTGAINGKSSSSAPQQDANGKKSRNGTTIGNSSTTTGTSKQSTQGSHSQNNSSANQPSNFPTSSSGHHNHSKPKSSGLPSNNNSRMPSAAANEDEDLDMESDSQDDGPDAYQFEFTSVEVNIVTSKAVQDVFRQVITQFRQAQSRKRSLSLTSGVKLQELVASNPSTANGTNSSTPPIPESPDPSSTTPGTQTQPSPTLSSTPADASNVVSMERESLARPLMKTVVKHILHSSKSPHSPVPQYGLFAEGNISAGRFLIEFKGEVSLKSTYKSDPINQYSILATPKPFVLFHPHLNLVVDARRSGNDARFVRRACTPNTEIKSIVVPGVQDQTVHLGLFSKVPIGKGEEITLDWDWNKDHPALQSIKAASIEKAKDGSSRKTLKEIRKAKHLVASTLLAQTDCACETKDVCVVHQMLKDGAPEPGTRDLESSTSSTKGSRPKKTMPLESLRQRYGSQRERSGQDGHDNKRSIDQESSEDDELSVAGSSPRRKSPKISKSESNSSKKARHDSPSSHSRNHRVDDRDSDSDSDSHRRRKQNLVERGGSPLKRTSATTINQQEMSPRELKQAQMLIKKMEDKDAALASHSKQKTVDATFKDSDLSPPKRSGAGSGQTTRPRDKSKLATDSDNKPEPSRLKTSNFEDDNVSIGDSGIDSDSNNGFMRRDPLSAHKRPQPDSFQGKRDRSQMELDAMSQSPATSDSERKDHRGLKRPLPPQSVKKQPYAAVSRGKRIDNSNLKASKDRPARFGNDILDDSHNLSGSSSVEGGFVSIVGNTSDEEEEASHRADRRLLREQNMPKETLPVASLKPSVLPCKKVWKMIYMKQRALAEEEARERAEEMRKKAEEVFDLKMEEDDALSGMGAPAPAPNVATVETMVAAVPSKTEAMESIKVSPPTEQPSLVVAGDVLNLFQDDVQPETTPSSEPNSSQRKATKVQQSGSKSPPRPTVLQEPAIAAPSAPAQEPNVAPLEPSLEKPAKAIQKLSLESYHARRLASTSPGLSDDSKVIASAPIVAAPITVQETTTVVPGSVDVEMKEPSPLVVESTSEVPSQVASDSTGVQRADLASAKPEPTPAIPKVKLSLQEYQKQRLGASQRSVNTLAAEGSVVTKYEVQENDAAKDPRVRAETVQVPSVSGDCVDVEMAEQQPPQDEDKGTARIMEYNRRDRTNYFEVGAGLSTPRINLSSQATQSSGDYFPVQPFSPISLSAGPTPFSKMTLTSSPPRTPLNSDGHTAAISPGKSPVGQRPLVSPGSREMQERLSPGSKQGSPPPQSLGSSGWRTPRSQRGGSPQTSNSGVGGGGNYRNGPNFDARSNGGDARLTSPRYHGSPSDRPERPSMGSLDSPTRERQQSLTSGVIPGFPFEGNHYGYNDESSSFKRSGPLSSPTGPVTLGPREYYNKSDERSRHRSMNGDDWNGYGGMESINYGGYRGGPRGGMPPPPRDRERERERDRERDLDRDRERDRRDRYDRRGEYFAAGPSGGGGGLGGGGGGGGGGPTGNNAGGFYGGNRGPTGPSGPGGMTGGYSRRPSV
ncbi:hypothetical protein BGX23_007009 [Mortierella sp. AD031]|nr:hypothetical protein BGX23_007009 [Mortierella sp. AD031]